MEILIYVCISMFLKKLLMMFILEQVAKARDVGVNSIVLFPKVPDALKVHNSLLAQTKVINIESLCISVCVCAEIVSLSLCDFFSMSTNELYYNFLKQSPSGDEAYNDNGLVPRTIRLLKDKYPDLVSWKPVHP